MDFNKFYWHDSVIKEIRIDRNNPGIADTIILEIKSDGQGLIDFQFEDVYWAKFTLNFGVVAQETILNAFVLDDNDSDLVGFYSKWKGAMDSVKLKCYLINLNSTGGVIKIISKSIRVISK
ncbi:MAG TPA: hypothetical protein VLJ68_07255 [Chitinophagaceae bacterium]|nr:hypothetical protein [Chitinophagaceae bacterium]